MLRSRTLRALIAIGAGIFGAGSVVCASMAFTHPSHASPTLASLAPVSGVAATPDARSSATGLLAWHAPTVPAPMALQPRVVRPVRVVVVTRRVARKAAPVKPRASRTSPARRVSVPTTARQRSRVASGDRRATTESASGRTPTRTDTTRERASRDDEQRAREQAQRAREQATDTRDREPEGDR